MYVLVISIYMKANYIMKNKFQLKQILLLPNNNNEINLKGKLNHLLPGKDIIFVYSYN